MKKTKETVSSFFNIGTLYVALLGTAIIIKQQF